MTRVIKKPDGEVIEDRRKSNGVQGKLIFLLVGVLASSITFSASKWINPIQSKVEALESDYKDHLKDTNDKELATTTRLTKVEEGFLMVNSRLERMDNKIDKLLERSFREIRPYIAEKEGSA